MTKPIKNTFLQFSAGLFLSMSLFSKFSPVLVLKRINHLLVESVVVVLLDPHLVQLTQVKRLSAALSDVLSLPDVQQNTALVAFDDIFGCLVCFLEYIQCLICNNL